MTLYHVLIFAAHFCQNTRELESQRLRGEEAERRRGERGKNHFFYFLTPFLLNF